MAESTTETNGTEGATGKEESVLSKLHKEHLKRTGGKKPEAKVIKTHKEALQTALDTISKGEKLVAEGQAAFEKASQAAMQEFGRTKVAMANGVVLEPSCRGERLYYKRVGQEDAI